MGVSVLVLEERLKILTAEEARIHRERTFLCEALLRLRMGVDERVVGAQLDADLRVRG